MRDDQQLDDGDQEMLDTAIGGLVAFFVCGAIWAAVIYFVVVNLGPR